tara:strand:+ start:243 stop:491 length:249 start_codon:yes stop_codon:yes gene_type:complete
MSETPTQNITSEVTPVASESTPAAPAPQNPGAISLPPPGKPLGQQLALELLCRGIHLAQSRGAFKLDEASIFNRAIGEFVQN